MSVLELRTSRLDRELTLEVPTGSNANNDGSRPNEGSMDTRTLGKLRSQGIKFRILSCFLLALSFSILALSVEMRSDVDKWNHSQPPWVNTTVDTSENLNISLPSNNYDADNTEHNSTNGTSNLTEFDSFAIPASAAMGSAWTILYYFDNPIQGRIRDRLFSFLLAWPMIIGTEVISVICLKIYILMSFAQFPTVHVQDFGWDRNQRSNLHTSAVTLAVLSGVTSLFIFGTSYYYCQLSCHSNRFYKELNRTVNRTNEDEVLEQENQSSPRFHHNSESGSESSDIRHSAPDVSSISSLPMYHEATAIVPDDEFDAPPPSYEQAMAAVGGASRPV